MHTLTEKPVLFLDGEFWFCSNFAAVSIRQNDLMWPTTEHAYQAAKFSDFDIQTAIRQATSPYGAKAMAHSPELAKAKRPNWSEVKIGIMEGVVLAKIQQHPFIREALIKTGSRSFVEASAHDGFWGWGRDHKGANHLGKIWDRYRDALVAGTLPLVEL